MSPMVGDLDDIFSFGRRCGDESGGMDSVVNIYTLCCCFKFSLKEKFKYNNINAFDFLFLIYEIYTKLFSRG